MIRFRSLTILLLAGVSLCHAPWQANAAEPAKKARVLFVTQSAGFRHGSVTRKEQKLSPAEVAMTQLGQQTGLFDVHCTQDCAADFTRENLKNYDIVMFYTTLDLPIYVAELDYVLNDWLKQKGHGFIGFHSATDTFHENQPYWEMIAPSRDIRGSKNKVTITVHDAEHPGIKPFGGRFPDG
jgi:type 1 glutamine amidotransferase